MSTCPSCQQKISTPTTLDLAAWAKFQCPQCEARLVNAPTRPIALFLMLIAFGLLTRLELIDPIVVIALALFTIAIQLYKTIYPRLQLKPPPPEPEITLHLDQP